MKILRLLLRSKALWALVIVCFLLGAWLSRGGHNDQSSLNGIIARGDLLQRVTISGAIIPNRKTVISAPYNGYVKKIFVQVGQTVKVGDPIITVTQSLNAVGEEAFPLRAPFGGTVVQILKTEGEFVEAGSSQGMNTMVRIDDLSRLFVEAAAPEVEISKLKIAQDVVVRATAIIDRTYQGRIEKIALAAKDQAQYEKSRVEFPVVIEILDKDASLKPGMSAIVDVVAAKRENVLMVPLEYVTRDSGKYFVTPLEGKKKEIKVGLQNEEAFEITAGATEGEVIKPSDFMVDSQVAPPEGS